MNFTLLVVKDLPHLDASQVVYAFAEFAVVIKAVGGVDWLRALVEGRGCTCTTCFSTQLCCDESSIPSQAPESCLHT